MASYKVVSRLECYRGWATLSEVMVRSELRGHFEPAQKRVVVESGDAAAVLLMDVDTQELLFVRQLRIPLERQGDVFPLEIVAGKVDRGEEPRDTALREIREEVGHQLEHLEQVSVIYSSPGIMSEKATIFYGEYSHATKVDDGKLDEGEDLVSVCLPLAEAFAMLDRTEIRDAKTVVALHWLRNRLS
jgi:nudix-type nucleoside diphosphatase (YffH/AdpP family)